MKVTEILPPEQKAAGSIPAEGTTKVGPDQHSAGTGPLFGSGAIPQTAPYEPISPALSEWEVDAREYGLLPTLNKERLRDPAYLLARVQEAVGKAMDARTDARADIRDGIELASLHYDLRRIAGELKLQTPAADELLALLAELHPQIHWYRGGYGLAGYTEGEGALEVAERGARHLRLPESGPTADGRRRWTGVIETFTVSVYAPALTR